MLKDAVPSSWKEGLVQEVLGAAIWIDDFAKRLSHLEALNRAGASSGKDVLAYWLGGFFSPDAFITATRQHVASALSCSLEELQLTLVVGDKITRDEGW